MEGAAVIWSAASCTLPGFGVYIGLAEFCEHMTVARSLSAKRLRVFVGARLRIPTELGPWPLIYYAVRDPSAVRVKPVFKPATRAGFKSTDLHFRFDAALRESIAVSTPADGKLAMPGCFVMTIGMRVPLEERFYHQVIDHRGHQDWDDLFERLLGLGCGREPGK
jgi:hypothetical protein